MSQYNGTAIGFTAPLSYGSSLASLLPAEQKAMRGPMDQFEVWDSPAGRVLMHCSSRGEGYAFYDELRVLGR